MSPELRHLRSFLAVAEALSFSDGARRLFVSQQALSRTVKQLERELGVELFERSTRSVALTPAGQAMLEYARRATSAAEEAFDAARSAAAGDTAPSVRVDVSSGGIETGALILRRMRRERPDVAVREVELGVLRGLRALAAGELDVVLGLAPEDAPGVAAEVIRREPVLVGMAADHPAATRPAVPVAALAELELLLPSRQAAGEWVDFVAAFCRGAGFEPRRRQGVTHGSVSAAAVVREGGCVVPTMAWTEPPQGLVFRPLVDPVPVMPWSLMWLPEAESRPGPAAFLAAARAVAREEGWRAR